MDNGIEQSIRELTAAVEQLSNTISQQQLKDSSSASWNDVDQSATVNVVKNCDGLYVPSEDSTAVPSVCIDLPEVKFNAKMTKEHLLAACKEQAEYISTLKSVLLCKSAENDEIKSRIHAATEEAQAMSDRMDQMVEMMSHCVPRADYDKLKMQLADCRAHSIRNLGPRRMIVDRGSLLEVSVLLATCVRRPERLKTADILKAKRVVDMMLDADRHKHSNGDEG